MSHRILIALCATAAVSYGSLLLGSSLYVAALRRRLRRHAKLLTVNGQSINVSVLGDGEVTVVLDAGLGMSTISWHWIASIVASKARVVMFDRPALGCSPVSSFASVGLPSSQCYDKGDSAERVPWLRAVGDIVSLMHDVLDSLDAARGAGRGRRKLVLVGHSTAGMDVRLYCHRHGDEVKGLVLVDTASERQLNLLQGTSVYNTYPDVEETEAKLTRVRYLWRNGLFLPMYILSGPTFAKLCWYFPPLISLLRFFDSLGRAAAVQVRQNVKMLGPHLPKALLSQFMDEQLSPDGMEAMLAEHGSQRASMNYMLSMDLLKAGVLGSRPLTVVTRDPAKGAGGRLYPNAKGDVQRETQHATLQAELAALSSSGRIHVVQGAGHGSLLFVEQDAKATAHCICDVVQAVLSGGAEAVEKRRSY